MPKANARAAKARSNRPSSTKARKAKLAKPATGKLVKVRLKPGTKLRIRVPPADPRIAHALEALASSGKLRGSSRQISVRMDSGLVKAAQQKTGIDNPTDLITAGLAVLAASDDFGRWLVQQAGRLPEDFTLDF